MRSTLLPAIANLHRVIVLRQRRLTGRTAGRHGPQAGTTTAGVAARSVSPAGRVALDRGAVGFACLV